MILGLFELLGRMQIPEPFKPTTSTSASISLGICMPNKTSRRLRPTHQALWAPAAGAWQPVSLTGGAAGWLGCPGLPSSYPRGFSLEEKYRVLSPSSSFSFFQIGRLETLQGQFPPWASLPFLFHLESHSGLAVSACWFSFGYGW